MILNSLVSSCDKIRCMLLLKKVPHTYAIIVSVILFCAVLSWVVPAGEYERQTSDVNGVKRTVIVPGSFHRVEAAPQTWQVFSSLLDGFEKQAGIIAFLLIIGGAALRIVLSAVTLQNKERTTTK